MRAAANAGHAGLHFARYLVEHRPQLVPRLRADHARLVDRIVATGGDVRLASYLATIELGATLFAEVFGFAAPDLEKLWTGAQDEVKEQGDELAAFRWLGSHVAANAHRVEGLGYGIGSVAGHGSTILEPVQGSGGTLTVQEWSRAEQFGLIRNGRLCLHEAPFEQAMQTRGFDPNAALRTWDSRQLIVRDGRNLRVKVMVGPARPRMIVFTHDATEQLLGIEYRHGVEASPAA